MKRCLLIEDHENKEGGSEQEKWWVSDWCHQEQVKLHNPAKPRTCKPKLEFWCYYSLHMWWWAASLEVDPYIFRYISRQVGLVPSLEAGGLKQNKKLDPQWTALSFLLEMPKPEITLNPASWASRKYQDSQLSLLSWT